VSVNAKEWLVMLLLPALGTLTFDVAHTTVLQVDLLKCV
jgi:hypothetical protein